MPTTVPPLRSACKQFQILEESDHALVQATGSRRGLWRPYWPRPLTHEAKEVVTAYQDMVVPWRAKVRRT
ncbi:hypothetical protein ACTMU2_31620 [Cupriavidus basilensis]